MEPRRYKLIIIVVSFFVAILILTGVLGNVVARTPPGSYGEAKPDNFLILLPWEEGKSGWVPYYSYRYCDPNPIDAAHCFGANFAVDFNVENDAEIRPIAPGIRVCQKNWDGISDGYGNHVVIRHQEEFSNYYSIYAHLRDNPNVPEEVLVDTPLGFEGSSGTPTPHLHFALMKCDGVLNPNSIENQCGNYLDNVCQAVVPEPILGQEVYEGLLWWKTLNRNQSLIAAEPQRPTNDNTPPKIGSWIEGASGSPEEIEEIAYGEPIIFNISYGDDESGIGEIRLTAKYDNWTNADNPGMCGAECLHDKMFNESAAWRIIARCEVKQGSICNANDWKFVWESPHKELNHGKPRTDLDGLLDVPWLPKANPIAGSTDQSVDLCISFDVFDKAGNPRYSPGSPSCSDLSTNSVQSPTATLSNEARRIRILSIRDSYEPPANADFVRDITIPDGFVASPGQSLAKTWRMRNMGSTTWSSGYQLVFVGGEQMGAPGAVSVPAAGPGQEVNISVNLTAPSNPGEHKGYWRMRSPQGTYFGPRIWVQINVQTSSSRIETLTADPPSPADTADVTIRASAYDFPNLRAMRVKIDGEVKYELGAPEIIYNWHTAGYDPGDHSIVIEATDQGDLNWSRAEQRSMIYHLTGNAGADNRAPNRPDVSSPHDWYVYYSGNTARLCANHNGDPDGDAITGYYFDVYESAQIWNSGWSSGNCVTTSSLGPYNYQWRVKVRDSLGKESDWSDSWHFTLVNPNLEISEMYFQALDPKSEVIKIRACTEGQGGVGITMRVMVNDANDGSSNGNWKIIHELGVPCYNENDAPTWNSLKSETGTYRFRVEAHGSGSGWDGAASREETYAVPHRRPPSPELIAPRPSSGNIREPIYLDSRTITFRWQAPLRANSVVLHISDQVSPKDDATPVYRQTLSPSTTEQTVTFSQDHPTLYWQVEAINELGSNASGDQQFGIDRTQPTCSIDTLPGVSYENIFQVKWASADNLSGPTTADIQVLDSGRDEWLDWLTSIPIAQTYDLFSGQPGHSYQFRCRAIDQADNMGNYSSPSTEILIDPESRPTETWWNTAYGNKRTISILNNMSGKTLPTGYPVHLLFDGTTTPSASEIYNNSLTSTKCNDVRIVHDNSTDLNRTISTCTTSKVDIWFKTQSAIGAGTVDNSSYRLYYGNGNAGTPLADQKQVWPPLADGNTVGLWFLSEGTGATTVDHSGYGNNGNRGIYGWTDGKFGKALTSPYPAKGNDGLYIPGSSSMGSAAFTLDFFAKRSDTGSSSIAGMGMSGDGRERMRLLADGLGKLKFQIDPELGGASDIWAQSGCLPDLEWHHIAVTFDGNRTGKIYCDGVLRGSGTFNESGISNRNFDLYVGSDFSTGTRFHGAIDQVRLSNVVRTSFPHGLFAAITNEPSLAVGGLIDLPQTGAPDLVILELNTFPTPAGEIIVQATIMNQGDKPTNNGFFTDLYVDQVPVGPGDTSGSISYWVNESLEPGETVELTTAWTSFEDPLRSLPFLRSANNANEISGTLYAQVDSSGAITEPDDANNILDQGTEFCLAEPDLFEDDDSVANPSTIALGETQTHNFSKLDDEDWLQFTAESGKTYRLSTSGLATAADTYIYLYDTDGTTLLTANDDDGDTLASSVVWMAPADGTYYAAVTHWNPNAGGCDNSYSIEFANAAVTHGIQLASGWNMLSSYVTPDDPSMDAIFPLPWRDDLVLCKDNDGRIYWPEFGINSIGSWDAAQGYKCYTNLSISINLTGLPIDPAETIDLQAGWNMVAYWRDAAMPVDQALSSLGSSLVLAKTGDGRVYWPEFGINQIGNMQPGEGYKIYMSEPGTLNYPAN